jgi:hypothetical protein
MQKCGEVIEKFSPQEPLSQMNSSDLYESFLTWCRFKLVQIMVPEGWEGPQEGNFFFYMRILERIF